MKIKRSLILYGVLVIVLISIISLFLFKKDNQEMSVETKTTISTLADGTAYIFGAVNDQSFKVKPEAGFSYKIVDEENNEIKATTSKEDNYIIINAPKGLYEQGKLYTLVIENATFENEDLKNSKIVIFSIKREAKQVAKFKDNVKVASANKNKVTETAEKIILQSNENYKIGSIIVVEDEFLHNAYKIESKENGTYQLSKPEINELYDELDYYGSYQLDLSNFEGNEEIQEYLKIQAKKSVLEAFIPTVNAAEKINIKTKWDEKTEEVVIEVEIENAKGQNIFKKSFLKYHNMTFKYEYRIQAIANVDIDLSKGKYDINISFRTKDIPQVTFEYNNGKLKDIQESLDKYASSKNVYDALKLDYDKLKKDKKEFEQKLGTFYIKTPIPGLDIELGIALIMDLNMKADINAKLTSTKNIVVGVSSKKGIYGSHKRDADMEVSVLGETKMQLGAECLAGVSLVGLAKLNATLEGGVYGKASLEVKGSAGTSGLDSDIVITGEGGTFSKIKLNAEVFGAKMSHTVVDEEYKLLDINNLLASSKEEIKEEPVSKEEKEDSTESEKAEEPLKNDEPTDTEDESTESEDDSSTSTEEPKEEKPSGELTNEEKIARGNIAREKFFSAFESWANSQGYGKNLSTYKNICPGVGDDLKCYAKKEEYAKENLVRERYYIYRVKEWYMSYRGFEKYYTITMEINYGSNGSISMEYDINKNQVEISGVNGVKSKIESACQLPVYAVDPLEECINKNFDKNYTDASHIKNVFEQVIRNAGISRDELLIDAYIKEM